ncbi:Chromate transporter [Paenibacillus mucilaginosus 3016]|uniref:Chromate transporter n=1 Tax=Paenibacillus mucilaginosus 3016 TaxID=1116391 RepID=H6NP77_9BACL|nr:chromate transporter [Paenibacillus mucilaginosus]AFC31787.1 Chromate transporter [Paenibacillus mucilaginosus 3016]WFA20301.1 chromate transporter [Paenibacillus mucilaginosus]
MGTLLVKMFWSFVRISPMTFGGGYAMIPLLEREFVEKRQWITREEMSSGLAVAGSAPGGIGVNAAAFIGYRMKGVPGAAAAILGITLPTFLIVLVLGLAFAQVQHHPKAAAALAGIQAGVAALILVSAYNMGRSSLVDRGTMITAAAALVLLLLGVHPIGLIAAGLLLGHAAVLFRVKREGGRLLRQEPAAAAAAPSYKYADYYIADGI